MDLHDKQIVFTTDCSSGGIDHALARAFVVNDRLVVATSRSKSPMSDLQHDPRFYVQELDVLSDQSVKDVISDVEKFGQIDILVNNAGVGCIGPLAEIPLPAVRRTFDTNVYGPLRLVEAVVPHMASGRKGKIVNIGSVSGLVPLDGPELRQFGIDVINVAPGAIQSNLVNTASANNSQMPEWKFYKQFDEAMRAGMQISQGPKSMPSEEFAKKTVATILKKNPPFWYSLEPFSLLASIVYHLHSKLETI